MRRPALYTVLVFALAIASPFQKALSQSVTTVEPDKSKNNDGIYFDGIKAEMLGDNKQAISLFEQFVQQKPKESAGFYELSRLYGKEKNDEKAEENIKKAIALDDTNKWYKEQYAAVLTNRNEFEKAAEILKELAKTTTEKNSYLLTATMLYERGGKYKEALETLDRIIKDDPDEDILLQKQQIYLKMNDVDNAAKVANQLITLNPHEGKYYTMMAELYDNNKQYEKAAAVLAKAQKMIPNDPSIQYGLAEHYRKLNDSTHYNEYVKQVITNKDLDIETQLSLLGPYLQDLSTDSAKKTEGLALVKQLVAQHPQDARVLLAYGEILAMNNQHNEASEQYKKALAINPSTFGVWEQLLSDYSFNKNDADSLIKYSNKALRYFPNQAVVYYFNGIGEFNKRNYPGVIKSMNHALDLQGDDDSLQLLGNIYSVLGDVYNTLKEYERSDSSFERLIHLEPANASALNNYSYYLSERGVQLEKAAQLSSRSLALRPGEPTFMDTYGWILYKQHKYDDAKLYIQKAVDASPDNADATLFEHLGNVYYKLGDKEKAVELWKLAKVKGSENSQLDKEIEEKKLYE